MGSGKKSLHGFPSRWPVSQPDRQSTLQAVAFGFFRLDRFRDEAAGADMVSLSHEIRHAFRETKRRFPAGELLGIEGWQAQVDRVAFLCGFHRTLIVLAGEHLADAQSPRGILPIGILREEFFHRLLVATSPPGLKKFPASFRVEAGEECPVRSGLLETFARRLIQPDHC